MMLIRRQFLHMGGGALALPALSLVAEGQGAPSPKLAQILRSDLQGQGQVVQETVLSILEMPPGAAAPWHMHPGAQEIIFVLDGQLVVEIDKKAAAEVQTGATILIPAETAHLARNDTRATAKALVMHSRADKQKVLLVVLTKPT